MLSASLSVACVTAIEQAIALTVGVEHHHHHWSQPPRLPPACSRVPKPTPFMRHRWHNRRVAPDQRGVYPRGETEEACAAYGRGARAIYVSS